MIAHDPGPGQAGADGQYRMRASCAACGSVFGTITETGAQDVVRCVCGKFQYNAPRVETGKAVRSITTVHNGIKPKQRAEIIMRAGLRCEACKRSPIKPTDELHVGHGVSVKDGLAMGMTEAELNSNENLLALCSECNIGLGSETVPLWLMVAIVVARARIRGGGP